MKHEISPTAQERAGSTQGAKPAASVALSAPDALREPLDGFTQQEIDSGLARVALGLPADVERLPLDHMVLGLAS